MNFKKKNKKEEIVVFGIGKLGVAILKSLSKENKYYLIAIDENEESAREAKDIADSILIGDATDEDFLEESGITNASIFIIAIGDDLQSSILISSLLLDKFDGRVIVRSENRVHRTILRKLGVNTIINPNIDSAQKIVNQLNFSKLQTSLKNFEIINIDESVSFAKMQTPKQFLNVPVKDLEFPKEILISLFVRDNTFKVVTGETILEEKDEIYIVGESKIINKVASTLNEKI